jgi:hypothetical protein
MLLLIVDTDLAAAILTGSVGTVMWLTDVPSITLTAASGRIRVSSLSVAVAG